MLSWCFNTLHPLSITILESLWLRQLLDQSDFSYWALLGSSVTGLGPSGSFRVILGPSGP